MSTQLKYDTVTHTIGSNPIVLLTALTLPLAVTVDLLTGRDSILTRVPSIGSAYVREATSPGVFRLVDLLNSTAIYALQKLDILAGKYPNLAANIDDARIFARSLPFDLMRPRIWTDKESEVAFEWKDETRHAMVSFEGNHSYGYALRRGNRFVPGAFPGDLNAEFPRDLLNYLSNKATA